jgi:hypothetical protein
MHIKFREAFVKRFNGAPEGMLWSDDPLVRTSAMTAYIYPAIAAQLQLVLVLELNKRDATYFGHDTVRGILNTKKGFPHALNPEIIVEHESISFKSKQELTKLTKETKAKLNVLITYPPSKIVLSHNSWLEKTCL